LLATVTASAGHRSTAGQAIAGGHHTTFIVTAVLAAGLVVLAAIALPAVRPPARVGRAGMP
jgi:hypothetical protein